ncbi:MAG: endonuclease/exonuclease/phosphatase family protein [Flavobacteriales bacterium]|nr:endonuclease/exonuclease/phosphatase family protein [Flavobacteriales bacterium]
MSWDFTVAFYNVENFFDVKNNPRKNDEAFTPHGEMKWDEYRYHDKIENLAEVIKGMGLRHTLPAFIGFAEVENRKVIEDLLEHRDLDHEEYGIVHAESRDVRGIDVALAYSKNAFEYDGHRMINFERLTGEEFNARDIMYVWGRMINGDKVHLFINHWPSRRAGKEKTEYKRLAAATALREEINNIQYKEPDARIIIMGDFNDQPHDASLRHVLKAGENGHGDQALVNLGWPISKRQWGSVSHEDEWFLFDMFIVTGNLLNKGALQVYKERMRLFDEGDTIYKMARSNKVKPNRTYVGRRYVGGYSDHLAVFMRIKVEELPNSEQ